MNEADMSKTMTRAFMHYFEEGSVSVPFLLLKSYRKLKLNDTEAMLLIQLIAFKEKEQKSFPTIEEIQSRMGASPEAVIVALQNLMKERFLTIDEEIDPVTSVQSEKYNLYGMYEKLARCVLEESKSTAPPLPESNDIFTVFEQEFGRPLTPMECENIANWIDRDSYSETLILTALKEAVFAGKLYIRYIDRILLEWSRNRIETAEQAKQYSQQRRLV